MVAIIFEVIVVEYEVWKPQDVVNRKIGPFWSVVNTLLKRANNIPSTNKGRREEMQRVKAVLRDNNYPMSFIRNCERVLTKQPAENSFNGFVVLPYVQGVSEKTGRILKQQKVKVAHKPQQTINSLFPHPKELDDSDRQKSGIVYKINWDRKSVV